MTRLLVTLGGLGLALLISVFALALRHNRDRDPAIVPSVLIGKPLLAFSLPSLEGRRQNDKGLALADLKGGGVSLVNFWASWCAPCEVEHPILMRLSKRTDISLHGISYKDRPEDALGFLIAFGDPFAKVGRDAAGRTAIDWGVSGPPETFVIDGSGRVVARVAGPLTERELASTIEPAIRVAGKP